ncbi:MAG: hypothetical protein K940chlam3_01131 [Chlamydiae bacterium]|nr:hypothetical protein [Chlamydiota bacterium]
MYTNPNKLFDFLFGKPITEEVVKSEPSPETLEKIPNEVMVIIFNYLSPDDFSKLRTVCKHWKNITSQSSWFMCYHLFQQITPKIKDRCFDYQETLLSKNFNIRLQTPIGVELVESVISRDVFDHDPDTSTFDRNLGTCLINSSDKMGVDFSINEVCGLREIDRGSYVPKIEVNSFGYKIEIVHGRLTTEQLYQIEKLQKFIDEYFDKLNPKSNTSGYFPLVRSLIIGIEMLSW